MLGGSRPLVRFYEVLQVEPTASKEEIEQAYKRLSQYYDPEISGYANGSSGSDAYYELKTAYETLIDDEKKEIYDKSYLDRHQKMLKQRKINAEQ